MTRREARASWLLAGRMGAPESRRRAFPSRPLRYGNNPRRGVVALSFAVGMLLLIFITVAAFLLAILAGGARAENAAREVQALYAAEAGIDLALQAGAEDQFTGRCGQARFAVKQGGNEIAAVGQVERAAGAPIRCAVVVRVASGGGMVAGSWRQVPAATRPQLAGLLGEHAE